LVSSAHSEVSDPLIGDPQPEALARYFSAIDDRRFEDATACFSAEVLFAIPPRGAAEVDARRECRGRPAMIEWFSDRGSRRSRHQVLLSMVVGTSCMIEGLVHDPAVGGEPSTFASSLQLDGAGLISRYLSYMCAPAVVPGPASDGDGPYASAAAILNEYFDALEAGEFEDAAGHFSEGVLYSHPPYRHSGITDPGRISFRGREELVEGFRRRGKQAFRHRILAQAQRGPNCLIEGKVDELPEGRTGSFLSSLSLDQDGRIQRYVSFYCEPAVARV
jgi:hypothetical protein